MKTNGQVLDLFVDLEKEQYDWKKDIIINKLENSVEIKAFSKDRVYVKLIPLGLPLLSYNFKDELLTLEFKAR